MYRRSFVVLFTTHSIRAVPFEINAKQAEEKIKEKYNSRWFGPSTDYMNFKKSSAEYLPFFLCRGEMRGVYTATIRYEERSTDSKGNSTTTTRSVSTEPQRFVSSFQENSAQIYAGYKFSNRQVMKVIADPQAPLIMKKVHEVDTSAGNINLFEMSTTTLGVTAKATAQKFADAEATRFVEGFHMGNKGITISWEEFEISLDDVFPCYLPAIISEIEYDGEQFTLYTSGRTGNSTGPYLLSGVTLSRVAALATVGIATMLAPNKLLGFLYGSIAAVPLSYAAYFFGKRYPVYVRDRNRKERLKRQEERRAADEGGYRPNMESRQRVRFEKQNANWKEQKYSAKKQQIGRVSDPDGYYKILKVAPNASISDIQQAYRQQALQHHPDAGGDAKMMQKLNEAYRVLRDPKEREAYDRK